MTVRQSKGAMKLPPSRCTPIIMQTNAPANQFITCHADQGTQPAGLHYTPREAVKQDVNNGGLADAKGLDQDTIIEWSCGGALEHPYLRHLALTFSQYVII